MTEFEFVSVLISMIMGLGITQLLRGVAQAVHDRESASLDPTHLVWTAAVFVLMVLNWWVLFTWRTHELWSASTFLVLIFWAVSMYLMAVFLYPPRKDAAQSWRELYYSHRRWILSSFMAHGALDIWITALRGDLLDPPIYLPFVGHLLVLAAVGLFVARSLYHSFLPWYLVVTMLTWFVVIRRMLG